MPEAVERFMNFSIAQIIERMELMEGIQNTCMIKQLI